MPLLNYNKKATCGNPISSSCVFWDGGHNDVITTSNVPCNASIEEVTLVISEAVKTLNDELDLSSFSPGSLSFNKSTQKVKDLLQVLADNINQLNTLTSQLQVQIAGVANGGIDIECDLGCLQNEISNCQTPPVYSLLSLITLFKDQICLLKNLP